MPFRAFVAYATQIPRLQAEEDLRLLYVARAAQAEQKGFREFAARLRDQMEGRRRTRSKPRVDTVAEWTRIARESGIVQVEVVEGDELRRKLEARRKAEEKADGG